jgi:uncharacterized protein (TIGR00369 family)
MQPAYGVVSRDVLLAEDGLSFLRAMLEGRHPGPPIAETLDFTLSEVAQGAVVFTGQPGARFLNPLGTVHGGWTATLLDSAMACAVHATLAAGEGYTTLEMKLNYVRPVLPDGGPVRCEGRVIHRGGSIATSEGRLLDARGKLLAHGTETCMIFGAKPAG